MKGLVLSGEISKGDFLAFSIALNRLIWPMLALGFVFSIIHLGRALGLGVVAEGVETLAQVQALRLAGASHLQGYFFSRPVDADVARGIAQARFMMEPEEDATPDPVPGPRLSSTGTRG